MGRGVGVTEPLIPRCPHADHDMFDALALYPGAALAHKRRRTCLLPVSSTPMWEADWLNAPSAVVPNQIAPHCGGPWYAHVEKGLTRTHCPVSLAVRLSLSPVLIQAVDQHRLS